MDQHSYERTLSMTARSDRLKEKERAADHALHVYNELKYSVCSVNSKAEITNHAKDRRCWQITKVQAFFHM